VEGYFFLINEDSICTIDKMSDHVDLLWEASLIIWDEIPMQHCHCPKVVDALGDLYDNDSNFGSITIVFGGDFCQILLVIVKGSRV